MFFKITLLLAFIVALTGCEFYSGSDSPKSIEQQTDGNSEGEDSGSEGSGGEGSGSSIGEQTGPHSINLTWTIPTEFEDGTPLKSSVIASYKIHWGKTPVNLDQTKVIEADITQHSINNLNTGTYFVAVSVKTKTGAESVFSNIQEKTFP